MLIRVVSLSPELPLASAPATQGITITLNSALSHCEDNEKVRYFLALFTNNVLQIALQNAFVSLGRTPLKAA